MGNYNYRITVFTPTYNRAHTLKNLYNSIKQQKFKSFEWLIIDDGSTDSTEELVQEWITNSSFDIRYYKTKNGGKCKAINKALDLAKGELFFNIDSDDYLVDDALEKIDKWFLEIVNNDKVMGIVANMGFSSTETLNYIFPIDYKDMSLLEMYDIPKGENKIANGERAFVFYTDFHKRYKYPEFEGENFITEAVVWNRMAHDGFLMRFYNDILEVFEYMEDGLTANNTNLFINNPYGYGLWLKELFEFRNASFVEKMKMYYIFTNDMGEKYSAREISSFIGAPLAFIKMVMIKNKIIK